ncbi:hypothetical protein GCM10010264_58560 [Streptomyces globisporus]|nr:hypothetical protein GCM10010264_58560 [Streptomyces globisporus]
MLEQRVAGVVGEAEEDELSGPQIPGVGDGDCTVAPAGGGRDGEGAPCVAAVAGPAFEGPFPGADRVGQ